ncbi:MAG TPA: hypothetical protein VKA94_07665, partial [Hyphomicrobiales bacterium]|nr:hypothetical protein [Hyphomicrobiales bacterium]
MTPSQLVFELPHIPALGSEDFLISQSNEQAVRLIDSWPGWPFRCAILSGPQGAGKTHLVNVWRGRSGAQAFAANDFGSAVELAKEAGGPVAIEDFDHGPVNE